MAVVSSVTDGRLDVVGDAANDTILISSVDIGGVHKVTVNGQQVASGVNAADVTSIVVDAGAGNDTVNLSGVMPIRFTGLMDGKITVRGGTGNDNLVGSPFGDNLFGDDGNDNLTGGGGPDILNGGSHSNVYSFAGNADLGFVTIVQPQSGHVTTLQFANLGGGITIDISMTTPQVVREGQLTLTLSDGMGIANVQGTAYADVILGNARGNSLMGNGGNDFIWGRDGNDWIDCGAGNDFAYGGDGNDTILGKGGNDSLYGHDGDDILNGNEGIDYLAGDDGNDTYIIGAYGTKTINEAPGAGSDQIDVSGITLTGPLNLDSTSIQTIAASLSVRFTVAGAVEWFLGGKKNLQVEAESFQGGFYTVPGLPGTTTMVEFKYGGAVAGYSNDVLVFDATDPINRYAARPLSEYLFTGNVTPKGATKQLPFGAGSKLGFFIQQDGSPDDLFFSEDARNDGDSDPESNRNHLSVADLRPGEIQLSWEDLYYVLPNPNGYIFDGDYNDLFMGVKAASLDLHLVDLDVDSDNTGPVDRSSFEEAIEAEDGRPGVLIGNSREPIVVEVRAGTSATLILEDGADKITLWTTAEGGSMILSAAQPSIELSAAPGLSSEVWTFWIEATAVSEDLGDISLKLVPAGSVANSPLIDVVRATAAPYRNRAPEFQSDSPSEEDFYSFSVMSDHSGAIGALTALDDDGDALEYSGESDDFLVTANGAVELKPGAILLPGTYDLRAMVQDPHGELDYADVEIVVGSPDFGLWIEAIADAVEGGPLGLFRVSRADASSVLTVGLEVTTAPTTVPAAPEDYLLSQGNETFVGSSISVHFEPGQYTVNVGVTAFEDNITEFVEDLSLRLGSYTFDGGVVSVAAFNLLATVMLLDAQLDDGPEWQKLNNAMSYRALKPDASLVNLAMLVTGNASDWTSIWPHKNGDISKWNANGEFVRSPQKFAKADVSNLIATKGPTVVIFGKDPHADARGSKFVTAAQAFFAQWIEGELRRGVPVRLIKGLSEPGQVAAELKRTSAEGRQPIERVVFAVHWAIDPIPAEAVPAAALNWDDVATVKLNTNTLETAKAMIGPVRGWFTRNAVVDVFGCNTAGYADAIASQFLPQGAQARGTNATAFCFPTAAGFDLNDNDTFDRNTGEAPWTTVDDLLKADGQWSEYDGAQ